MDQPAATGCDIDRLAELLGRLPVAPLAMPVQVLSGPGVTGLVRRHGPGTGVVAVRAAALMFRAAVAGVACGAFLRVGAVDGLDGADIGRGVLILLATWWLALGAAQASVGLIAGQNRPAFGTTPIRVRWFWCRC